MRIQRAKQGFRRGVRTGAPRFAMSATLLLALAASASANAAVPAVLTEQGRLFDASDLPIQGALPFTFTIYDSPTGDNALWTETLTDVPLSDGYFSAQVGTVSDIPASVFDGSIRYLGIAIGSDAEMSPRQAITSVAYALVASNATGAITPTSISINGKQVIDEKGEWVGPASGLTGPAGPAGPPGETGAPGMPGMIGMTGMPGMDGQSVVGASEPPGANCAGGGVKLTSASGVNYVCNGDPGGPPGPTGPIGPIGPTGPVGPPGAAGQSVVGQSEPAGANCPSGGTKLTSASGASYVCNGTTGATGGVGPAGATGPVGAMGPTGATGAIGPAGAVGPTGPTGAAGPVGAVGPTGATGPIGPAGATGAAGQSVVGQSEPPGVNCATGGVRWTSASGISFVCNGPAGPTGPTGGIGPAGATGPIGLTGAAGPTGPTGGIGPAGATGPIGLTGAAGPTGPIGAVGPTGPAGAIGPAGAVGPTGPTGAIGSMGPTGARGPAGIVNLSANHSLGFISTNMSPQFMNPSNNSTASLTETSYVAGTLIPIACSLGMHVVLYDNPQPFAETFTVRVATGAPPGAFANTVVSCTVPANAYSCISAVTAPIAADSVIDLMLTFAGTFSTTQRAAVAFTCQ